MFETAVGSFAALCTTVSYLPQIQKCWRTGTSGDLSLKMLSILGVGIGSWVFYGILKDDIVIILSNGISLTLLCVIVCFKLREKRVAQMDKRRQDGAMLGDRGHEPGNHQIFTGG